MTTEEQHMTDQPVTVAKVADGDVGARMGVAGTSGHPEVEGSAEGRAERRYNVELPNGGFEDVGAANLTVAQGDLMFVDYEGELVILYARGYWKTVTPEVSQ